jgi:hypothetical protein
VKIVAGHWNKELLDELELFPYGSHDDQVDACSLAFNKLATKKQFWMRIGDVIIDGKAKEGGDYITVTDPKTGTSERLPYDPTQHVDLRQNAPGWHSLRRLW